MRLWLTKVLGRKQKLFKNFDEKKEMQRSKSSHRI